MRLRAEVQRLTSELDRVKGERDGSRKLQQLTLDNEIRWMRKHEVLLGFIESLRDWKSPDGVVQVKDLNWFKALPADPGPLTAATALLGKEDNPAADKAAILQTSKVPGKHTMGSVPLAVGKEDSPDKI